MEEQKIWLKIVLLLILLFFSGFFSASETGLSSLRRVHIGNIKNENSKEAVLLRLWLKNPNELLATLLFGKTIINLLLISIIIVLFQGLYKNNFKNIINIYSYITVVFVIVGAIMLIFTEVIPRVYAKSNVYKLSKAIIVPLNTVRIILRPFILIFLVIAKFILKIFKVKLEEKMFEITEEDIKIFVKEGTESGAIEEEEEEMIHSIFEFSDTTVSEILTPRRLVFAIDMEKTLGEVWDQIIEQGFSRIPIYNETIDKIVGILHMKELFNYDKKRDANIKIKEIMKDAYFIPATKTLIELLKEFKLKQTHIAIIIDEYGGTLGIITIEDLLEEIVGEIRDEFDQEEESIKQIKETIYDIKGDTLIEELNYELSIEIPISEEYDTVSGYVQYELGKLAEVGDQVRKNNYILKVLEMDNKRIEKIRVVIEESKIGE